MNSQSNYRGHRFPPEIISHAVWLYHRFTLSFRDIEELLAERGIFVSYKAIRQWCLKFGVPTKNLIRRCRITVLNPSNSKKASFLKIRVGLVGALPKANLFVLGPRHR